MAILIQPVIATQAQVAAYLGLSAGQLAATGADGVTTLGDFINNLLKETSWIIVGWCNRDYTTSQIMIETWLGNNSNFHICATTTMPDTADFQSPFNSWSISDPNSLVAYNEVTDLKVMSQQTDRVYINPTGPNKLSVFQVGRWYSIRYKQAAATSPQPATATFGTLTGWPPACQQVQIEMVAIQLHESAFGWGGGATTGLGANAVLGMKQAFFGNNYLKPLTRLEMEPIWFRRCMPYRRVNI